VLSGKCVQLFPSAAGTGRRSQPREVKVVLDPVPTLDHIRKKFAEKYESVSKISIDYDSEQVLSPKLYDFVKGKRSGVAFGLYTFVLIENTGDSADEEIENNTGDTADKRFEPIKLGCNRLVFWRPKVDDTRSAKRVEKLAQVADHVLVYPDNIELMESGKWTYADEKGRMYYIYLADGGIVLGATRFSKSGCKQYRTDHDDQGNRITHK